MTEFFVRIDSKGRIRKLSDPVFDRKVFRAIPRRASRVEVVEEPGPSYGRFYVDFSLLGEAWQFCLASTFDTHEEAVAAERKFLVANYIVQPLA